MFTGMRMVIQVNLFRLLSKSRSSCSMLMLLSGAESLMGETGPPIPHNVWLEMPTQPGLAANTGGRWDKQGQEGWCNTQKLFCGQLDRP